MTKRVIFVFFTEKKRKEEPTAKETDTGKTFTRKFPGDVAPPKRPPGASPVPITIEPTLQGTNRYPLDHYPLENTELKIASNFVDPADAAARAQLKSFTGSLLKKYGYNKDLGTGSYHQDPNV